MIKRILIAVLVFTSLMLGATTQTMADTIVALNTQNQLLTFDSSTPGSVTLNSPVTGLRGGEALTGIDFRPATGVLYGIGTQGGIYTINQATGAATLVGMLSADTTDTTAPFTGLNGESFGIDFNPVVDRLRLVSEANQNLRINVDNGFTTTDGNLAFAGSMADPTIVGSAYTNSFAGPPSPMRTTTLYGIDTQTNSLYIQNPPNDGTLVLVGSLGIDPASNLVGFDIGANNVGFASFTVVGQPFSQFYTINLATGAATLVGGIGGGASIVGLSAVPGAAPVPEPATMILLGTGLAGIAAKARRRRQTRKDEAA